jgi:predicted flap endonuclease-1-like 5' DNA nuclease
MANLVDIKGIGEKYASKLGEIGISTQEELLTQGAEPKGRQEIIEKTGISGKLILRWLNMADLARVQGITEAYANLLEHAGIDTVPELAQRNAKNLYTKMQEVNEEKNVVKELPSENEVAQWVSEAKNLPRAINY